MSRRVAVDARRLRNLLIGATVRDATITEGDDCFVISKLVFSNGLTIRFAGDYDDGGMCFVEGNKTSS